jgi:hypothetical protein
MQEPQEIEEREHELAVARVAAVDVAKASGVVCTRVPRERGAGRFVTKVWTVDATTGAVLELADHLAGLRIEKVVLESASDYWRIWLYLLEAAGLDVALVNARDVKNAPGRRSCVTLARYARACHNCGLFGKRGRSALAEKPATYLAVASGARLRGRYQARLRGSRIMLSTGHLMLAWTDGSRLPIDDQYMQAANGFRRRCGRLCQDRSDQCPCRQRLGLLAQQSQTFADDLQLERLGPLPGTSMSTWPPASASTVLGPVPLRTESPPSSTALSPSWTVSTRW